MTPEQMRRAAEILDSLTQQPGFGRCPDYAPLARLLREQAEAMEWRPIETAPRDRTWILVCERDGTPTTARWYEGVDGKMVLGGKSWRFPEWLMPTYWQPAPPPPQTTEVTP